MNDIRLNNIGTFTSRSGNSGDDGKDVRPAVKRLVSGNKRSGTPGGTRQVERSGTRSAFHDAPAVLHGMPQPRSLSNGAPLFDKGSVALSSRESGDTKFGAEVKGRAGGE